MGKSFFEKRPVFSIRKLSVGACSVVIGLSALGLSRVHAEEKPALESEPTSIETPSVVTENSETEVPEAGARVSEAPAVITPTRAEEKPAPQGEGQPVSASSELATGTEETAAPDQNRVAEDIVQDRERDFNKDWYFKLNAAPGAEGRQVDVKDWKKLDLPHDWSIFFDFDHNSPAQNEGGQLNGGDAWYRKTFRLDVRRSAWNLAGFIWIPKSM